MKTTNIEKLLGSEFCKSYAIDVNKEYEIEYIDSRELLVSNKIDLIAKLKYVESKDKKYKGVFFNQLYESHIDAFTNGSFVESNQRSVKNSIDKFYEVFDSLIKEIKENGIDVNKSVIPVGKNNTLLDGAHRAAIAIYYNQKVPIVRFENIEAYDNANFFKNRLMPDNFVNYMVMEYAKLKRNIYSVCLWPITNRQSNLETEVDEIFKNKSNIVYKTKIDVDINILRNLLGGIYSNIDRVGDLDNIFSSALEYAQQVNDKNETLTLYILEGDTIEEIKKIKEEIISLYAIGNSSIHISSDFDEAMLIMQLLLNSNSLHCLKYAKPYKFKDFYCQINNLKAEISKLNINPDSMVLNPESTISLYGLRNTNDSLLYEVDECDIISNPNYHLYYYGLKFVAVPRLLEMKKQRYSKYHEAKDSDDIELLRSINHDTFNNKIKKVTYSIKKRYRNIKNRFISFITHSIIYKPLKFIYDKIRK